MSLNHLGRWQSAIMTIDKLIITIFGIAGIIFTWWFFFGKKEGQETAGSEIDILVDGGYKPSNIVVKQNTPITLHFTRRDDNPCLEEVNLPDFKVKKYLPLNEKISITITPKNKGEFPFSCGMNMFHGKIIVREKR